MVAFNALYRLGQQVACQCDTEGMYTLAASNGNSHSLLLVNLTGKKQPLDIQGICEENARYSIIDQERLLSWIPNAGQIDNNSVILIEWRNER